MSDQVTPASNECERLINSDEAAATIGLSARQLRRLASSQELKAFKVGKEWKFRKSLLDEWARTQLAQPAKGGA